MNDMRYYHWAILPLLIVGGWALFGFIVYAFAWIVW